MKRKRARAYGICPGRFDPGPLNAITDVEGVAVGQVTLIAGEDVRTGVTAILPHGGNIFQDKVPAGLAVANGYGKLAGATQLQELGEVETPILLTNTLAVPRAIEALIEWTIGQAGNEAVLSVNSIVGETNDGRLNDIRCLSLMKAHCTEALQTAEAGVPVAEGSVGAGTGTVCFGWKGGIGNSSRRLPLKDGGYTLGVLVQTNFSGQLHILGEPLPSELIKTENEQPDVGGSIIIVLATDAPLSDRNLSRLAWRSFAGLARSGSSLANGSGDYALAFSTAPSVRRSPLRRSEASSILDLPNDLLSPLFQAAIETTEEAIYNALFMARSITGFQGRKALALPVERIVGRRDQ